jgi:hypothetical protein
MDTPTKVVVEITEVEATTTVYAGDKVLSKRTLKVIEPGMAKGTAKGDIFDDLKEAWLTELAERIDDLDVFSVLVELYDLNGN